VSTKIEIGFLHDNYCACNVTHCIPCMHAGLPSREELLIVALGLGGSGNDYHSLNPNTNIVNIAQIVDSDQVQISLPKTPGQKSGQQGRGKTPGRKGGQQGPTATPGPKGGQQGPTATPEPKGGQQGPSGIPRRPIPVFDNRRCPHNDRNGRIWSHIPGIVHEIKC
jgi:hypothetical protein